MRLRKRSPKRAIDWAMRGTSAISIPVPTIMRKTLAHSWGVARVSDPPVVRAPVLDRLLDVRTRKIFGQRALYQRGRFFVGRKTNSNQLVFVEFRDFWTQRFWQQSGETQSF